MRLAHRPEDINVGAVVRRMESDFQITECFGKSSRCSLAGSCGLTGILNEALQAFLERLDAHTLADVLPPVTGAPLDMSERPLRRIAPERAA
jgi:Rrf2 family nitric oxide-sensitive transcriptional repressor